MKTLIGIDPDTKSTGICCWTSGRAPRFLVAHAKGRLEEDRRQGMAESLGMVLQELAGDLEVDGALDEIEVAIEWQRLRPAREKNPNAMMAVQAVAGMTLAAVLREFQPDYQPTIYLPIPSDWRGTVKKEAKHALWMTEARLTEGEGPLVNVPAAALSHCKCALGLVLWLRRGRLIS